MSVFLPRVRMVEVVLMESISTLVTVSQMKEPAVLLVQMATNVDVLTSTVELIVKSMKVNTIYFIHLKMKSYR